MNQSKSFYDGFVKLFHPYCVSLLLISHRTGQYNYIQQVTDGTLSKHVSAGQGQFHIHFKVLWVIE
jgi:hypothetical protein